MLFRSSVKIIIIIIKVLSGIILIYFYLIWKVFFVSGLVGKSYCVLTFFRISWLLLLECQKWPNSKFGWINYYHEIFGNEPHYNRTEKIFQRKKWVRNLLKIFISKFSILGRLPMKILYKWTFLIAKLPLEFLLLLLKYLCFQYEIGEHM